MEGQCRFARQVRFQERDRMDIERIRNIKVADPRGRLLLLSQLTEVWVEQGPAQISRENVHRLISVETDIRGRDIGGFVADAQRAIAQRVPLSPGYWISWGGQFQNMREASGRLTIAVPLAFLVIFVLLYATFHSARPALLIFLNVPVAATGGILALALRGARQHSARWRILRNEAVWGLGEFGAEEVCFRDGCGRVHERFERAQGGQSMPFSSDRS